jgi:hypothetical protein
VLIDPVTDNERKDLIILGDVLSGETSNDIKLSVACSESGNPDTATLAVIVSHGLFAPDTVAGITMRLDQQPASHVMVENAPDDTAFYFTTSIDMTVSEMRVEDTRSYQLITAQIARMEQNIATLKTQVEANPSALTNISILQAQSSLAKAHAALSDLQLADVFGDNAAQIFDMINSDSALFAFDPYRKSEVVGKFDTSRLGEAIFLANLDCVPVNMID